MRMAMSQPCACGLTDLLASLRSQPASGDAVREATKKRRKFAEPIHQKAYDQLRSMRPDVEEYRGMGGGGNAYAVGYTMPDQPSRIFPKGSKAYAHWAAGVDNALEDAALTPTTFAIADDGLCSRTLEEAAKARTNLRNALNKWRQDFDDAAFEAEVESHLRALVVAPSNNALTQACGNVLRAFSEGVDWSPEQKQAYIDLHNAIAKPKPEQEAG